MREGTERLSLKPRIGIAPQARLASATFALLGFYAALAPNLLASSMHLRSPAVSGAIVAELFAASAVAVVAAPMVAPRVTMFIGLWLLAPSLALLFWVQFDGSLALLVAATAMYGIASAFGFRGNLQEVNRIAPAERRAEMLSAYLLCCYGGNSLPAVGVALLSRQIGHLWADIAFAGVSVALALAAIALIVGARWAEAKADGGARPANRANCDDRSSPVNRSRYVVCHGHREKPN